MVVQHKEQISTTIILRELGKKSLRHLKGITLNSSIIHYEKKNTRKESMDVFMQSSVPKPACFSRSKFHRLPYKSMLTVSSTAYIVLYLLVNTPG